MTSTLARRAGAVSANVCDSLSPNVVLAAHGDRRESRHGWLYYPLNRGSNGYDPADLAELTRLIEQKVKTRRARLEAPSTKSRSHSAHTR